MLGASLNANAIAEKPNSWSLPISTLMERYERIYYTLYNRLFLLFHALVQSLTDQRAVLLCVLLFLRVCEITSVFKCVYKNPEFHDPMSISLVISKLSQLLAMLGATFSRFGTIPLYSPLKPSVVTICFIASPMPAYLYPMPLIVLIWNRLLKTSKGYVIVCATAPETAPAPSFPKAFGSFFPSGVNCVRAIS